MDKKLKMKIAVAVVVILIVVGTLFYLFKPNGTGGERVYEVYLEVDETDTSWYINVTSITTTINGQEITENVTIPPVGFAFFINYNEIYQLHDKNYTLPRYGIIWENNNKRFLKEGDYFVLLKHGGTEYIPKEGDLVFIGHGSSRIESTKIYLP